MTECKDQRWLFQELENRKVEVDFGGGYLSSDGGGLILRELERHSVSCLACRSNPNLITSGLDLSSPSVAC
jgi:hypothetical protein